jgi:dTDP-4-dehydrorhamnose 3,5-epimerase-like enzyme
MPCPYTCPPLFFLPRIIFGTLSSSNRSHLRNSTIYDCPVLELPRIQTEAGSITALNNGINVPFDIKRVYYLYDVPGGETRGGHAHRELYQVLIAASGSFDVLLDDGTNKKTMALNRPYFGLLIVPGIWRELLNFSSGSICLVMASEVYMEDDYIRSYQEFKNEKR